MRPGRRSWAVLAAGLLAACSGGHASYGARAATRARTPRITSTGYEVPSPLAAAAPGTLIASRAAPSPARRLGAGRAWRVLYHSIDLSDRDIAVSGLVLVPKGRAPARGWPIVAWAHGTTGLADRCAPSIAPDLGHDLNAVHEVSALLAQDLAVVASDYPGLGTPGVHPYLIGAADANAVIDSVAAARSLLGSRASTSWISVGHSEGGQTALFVAQAARERAPRSTFLGTVALAPASTLDALIAFTEATKDPVQQAYLMYALAGLSSVDSNVHVASLLTPQARPLLADATRACVDDITRDFATHHVDHLLAADAATKDRLAAELGRYGNPDQKPASEPILITQGIADEDVPAIATDKMVTRLCALGDDVQYRRYEGLDHNTLIAGSQPTIRSWIAQRLAHDPPRSTCVTPGSS